MLKRVSEKDFFNKKHTPINYIGIYELDCFIDENQLDCEGIIVAFEDEQYLIKSFVSGEGKLELCYFVFLDEYNCRKILSSQEESICFVRKEIEEDFPCVLRFQIGSRPILVTADDDCLTIGISHWGINDEWLEFENNKLLND